MEEGFSITDGNYQQGEEDSFSLFKKLTHNEGRAVALDLTIWYNYLNMNGRTNEDIKHLVNECSWQSFKKIDGAKLHNVLLTPAVELPSGNLGCSNYAVRFHFQNRMHKEELVWTGTGMRYYRIRGVFEIKMRPQLGNNIFELHEQRITDAQRIAAFSAQKNQ